MRVCKPGKQVSFKQGSPKNQQALMGEQGQSSRCIRGADQLHRDGDRRTLTCLPVAETGAKSVFVGFARRSNNEYHVPGGERTSYAGRSGAARIDPFFTQRDPLRRDCGHPLTIVNGPILLFRSSMGGHFQHWRPIAMVRDCMYGSSFWLGAGLAQKGDTNGYPPRP
jgi:hypothetical protein